MSWASWILFTGVHALCVVLRVRCPGPPGSCSPVCMLCVMCFVYGVLGLLDPVHWCARSVAGVASTACWASWLLFTGVHALCVVLCVRCPGPPGSCSPVRTLCVWCCVRGVLGRLPPVHLCACSGVLCRVYGVLGLFVSGSPVCTPCVRCCVCGVLGLLAPVLRCACSLCCVVCPVFWASCFCPQACPLCVRCRVCGPLGLLALLCWCARVVGVVLCVWCPGTVGSCSPVSQCVALCVWCPVCYVACGVSWASRPLFTGAHARCVVLCGRCPGPLGSCSPVCLCGVLCGVCGVLGLVAPVQRCARSVCGVLCSVTWASWPPFTGAPVLCVAWCVRCTGPLGSRSPVCPRGVCCVACSLSWAPWLPFTGVLCACSVCCVLCAVSWATWLLFTGVRARCVAWCVRCGCGCVLACAIPLLRRCRLFVFVYTWIDTVGNAAANLPLASRPPRRPASYGVLLILPVLDSLILATPKSKRVLMHAWRCMLFTRWFVDSLHFAPPKSRRVCLMHS